MVAGKPIEWRRGPAHGVHPVNGQRGAPPAIMLWNPKYPQNVGAIVRLASCFGIGQVWQHGDRVDIITHSKEYRLPREERMAGYADVELFRAERPFDQFARGIPFVGIEFVDNAESLPQFVHPENAVYVFGPEDGSLPKPVMGLCHRFVCIPTQHCLNLSTTVAMVLYDRGCKLGFPGTPVPG